MCVPLIKVINEKGIPADDPWTDESCWKKANPGLPGIPGYEAIRREVENSRGSASAKGIN